MRPVSRRPAAQYLRVSTDRQCYSIENQRAAIDAYAAEAGYDIVRTYTDSARSGVTMTGRDGLKALLKDVMGGAPFSTVLVLDVSRWGRFQDPDQAAHYEFLCREGGVEVCYCSEPFENDGSPTASLVKSIKRVMAAEYSRQLSDRSRAGLRRQMLAGCKGGGMPPYGFSRQAFTNDGVPGRILESRDRRGLGQTVRLVHGPAAEVANVRTIFRMFTQDRMGTGQIARSLNDAGTSYRSGRVWNSQRVRRVLENEMARGVFTFNQTTLRLGVLTVNPRADWHQVSMCEPIVSKAAWGAAQRKLASLNGCTKTDEELIESLRQLLARSGFLTTWLIRNSPNMPGIAAYEKRFGSIEAALARVPYVRDRPYGQQVDRAGRERDEIVRRLRGLLEETGYLSIKLIRASPDLSISVIYRVFGSVREAYHAAGFDQPLGDRVKAGIMRAATVGSPLRPSTSVTGP